MNRIGRLLAALPSEPGQGVLVHKPSNIFYLTGYTGEGLLLLAGGEGYIVTDFRYTEQAGAQSPFCRVEEIGKKESHAQRVGALCGRLNVSSLRYEDDEVTVKGLAALKDAMPGVRFLPLDGAPEALRRIKDESELALIEQACDISCRAFDEILGFIKPGMTERQVQLKLDYAMLSLGADGLAFSTIVASGAHGSLPHAVPGERVIEKGDMVTMDFGAKKGGYCADMTRTVAVGAPSAQMRDIYALVLRAQEEAQAALAPGRVCSEIDAITRDMIYAAGYEGRFGHGLGHAVGIDIHENPRLSVTCDDVLEVGHVITVEPGVYLPGVGGVRIENTCALTANGARTLVHAPKELLTL